MDDLTRQALELLRYYRSRMHRVQESDDGGLSAYHTVYGVHADAMAVTDAVLTTAREVGLLVPAHLREEFHA